MQTQSQISLCSSIDSKMTNSRNNKNIEFHSTNDTVTKHRRKITEFSSRQLVVENSYRKLLINSPQILTPLERTAEARLPRKDANGTEIIKKNRKKIKVTFSDEVAPSQEFVEIIPVESYKKENELVLSIPYKKVQNNDNNDRENRCCSQGCFIF